MQAAFSWAITFVVGEKEMQIEGRIEFHNRSSSNPDNIAINQICHKALTIADLIVAWVDQSSHSLMIGEAPDSKGKYLAISFRKKEEALALMFCRKDLEIAQYPGFQLLNRNIKSFADQDGILPDLEWIEKRDKRLKIRWDEENQFSQVRPIAFGELILSYACSYPGLAIITTDFVRLPRYPRDIYKADLGSFDPKDSYGFHEIFATKLEPYERFVAGRYEKNCSKLVPYLSRK